MQVRLRLRRWWLRAGGIVLAGLAFLALCYALGDRLTPRSIAGQPLLLSPSVYAAERYRRAACGWAETMSEVDHGLAQVLAQEEIADPGRLYELGETVEELVRETARVAQDAAFPPAPPALAGLAEEVQAAAGAYLTAAQATARWVGAPEPEARYTALETLRSARALRLTLERSVWLGGGDGNN